MGATKYKISVSISESTEILIREGIRSGRFRNRSHALEACLHEVMSRDS